MNYIRLLSILVPVAILILFDLLVALEFSKIAGLKGYKKAKYFWFTFLLGLPGMLMVIALPTRNVPSAPEPADAAAESTCPEEETPTVEEAAEDETSAEAETPAEESAV